MPTSAPWARTASATSERGGGPAAVVDVAPVGRRGDDDHVGSRGAQHLGADLVGSTVRCVEHDAQPVEVEAVEEADDVGDVGLVVGGGVDDPAACTIGRDVAERGELGLDAAFDLVGQLHATAGEQLDSVVGPRVVRRRHDGTDRAATLRFERDLWGRRDAEAHDVEPFEGEAVAQRPVEDVGGLAGVTADDDARDAIGAQHPSRGAAEPRGELGGQFGEGDTADAVGAELHRADPISAW